MAKGKKKKGAKAGDGGRMFSVIALHGQLDKVLDRLTGENSPKAKALRAAVQTLRANSKCDQGMLIEI